MRTLITTATNNALVATHINAITTITGSSLKGMGIALMIEEVKRQMRNGVCHFIYKKANGQYREAFGTLDKNLLNATLKNDSRSPEDWGCCFYHDCIKGEGRSFRWQNLVAVLS